MKIMIVAGEVSGDMLGAALVEQLKVTYPNAVFFGVAGEKMKAAGVEAVDSIKTLSVGGIVEVLKHLPELLGLRRRLLDLAKQNKPDLFIGIDAPDFNIPLAKRMKALGIRTVHWVSPSIWAWRPERIHAIRKAIDHMLLILPFEQEIYAREGIPATYTGHPLADRIAVEDERVKARALLNIPQSSSVLAVMPGSRTREVAALAEDFIRTAKLLAEKKPELVFLVPLVSRETRLLFEKKLWELDASELNWRIMFGHSHQAMQACDVILQASGTAVLESMLFKRPVVVAYRLSRLTWWLVSRKFLLPYVTLPNIITRRFVVPEFLQSDVSPQALAQTVGNYLESPALRSAVAAKMAEQHHDLRCDAAQRAATAIGKLLPGV